MFERKFLVAQICMSLFLSDTIFDTVTIRENLRMTCETEYICVWPITSNLDNKPLIYQQFPTYIFTMNIQLSGKKDKLEMH